jgi:formylglycine-generating enzyme required for sulfatase activity
MADIFISYKREEQPLAKKLANALQKMGWSVWWDPKLRAGEHFDDAIERALIDAKCVIVMWSKLSVKSRYVKDEANYALKRNKLVPIAIEEVDLPFRFEGVHTEQLIDWDGSTSHSGFRELVQDLTSILGSPEPEKATELPEPAEQELSEKSFKNSIGMKFVLIPDGSFMMGSKLSPEKTIEKFGGKIRWYKNEHPQHEVTISEPFYLQTTQVTQVQWQTVMGANPSRFRDCGTDCPVEKVSWDEAKEFIDKLNMREITDKYRLPTEAEWEYACRAGKQSHFSFGNDYSKLSEYAWYRGNSKKQTHPVGTKKPNRWGLYDMHGNVWEWCQDWYGEYPSGSVVDPTGPSNGKYRVQRGGSWDFSQGLVRCAFRNWNATNYLNYDIGFRCAKDK